MDNLPSALSMPALHSWNMNKAGMQIVPELRKIGFSRIHGQHLDRYTDAVKLGWYDVITM